MSDPVRIGILGDYDPKSPTLPAIEKSLKHASAQLNMPVEAEWIATPEPARRSTAEKTGNASTAFGPRREVLTRALTAC